METWFLFDPTLGWTAIIQIIGFIVGILTVRNQMKAQRDNQERQHQLELQKQTYEKIAEGLDIPSPIFMIDRLNAVHDSLVKAIVEHRENGTYRKPPYNSMEIINEVEAVFSGVKKFASIIEKYEIVSPNLSLFREALFTKLRDFESKFYPVAKSLSFLLPSEERISIEIKTIPNIDAILANLKAKIDEFSEVLADCAAFGYDIRVETQNSLLGTIFKRKIPTRTPQDEAGLVLTSEDKAMLDRVRQYVDSNKPAAA